MRQDGSHRRAPHPHVKAENKDGVEDNIGHRANQDGQHSRLGKALGGDERVHPQGQLDEERPTAYTFI